MFSILETRKNVRDRFVKIRLTHAEPQRHAEETKIRKLCALCGSAFEIVCSKVCTGTLETNILRQEHVGQEDV